VSIISPSLVIFDCDGVLIDSEALAQRVEAACLAEHGFAIPIEEIAQRYLGISAAAMFADLEQRFGRPLPDGFAELLSRRIATLFEAELAVMPGVAALIDRIEAAVCVASSSRPERLRHTLSLVGLHHRFAPNIFSATQVARGKPAPDLFLFAAERMGVAPSACVVIEDSVPGVQAGVAAGMRVMGFTGGGHCAPGHGSRLLEAGATTVFDRMDKLAPALAGRG